MQAEIYNVSVIIPVREPVFWKDELQRTLDSLIRQKKVKPEILCVLSGEIPDSLIPVEFQCQVPDLRVIHSEQTDVEDLLLKGIESAAGKYLLFLLPGFRILPDGIETAVRRAKELDVQIMHMDYVSEHNLSDGQITVQRACTNIPEAMYGQRMSGMNRRVAASHIDLCTGLYQREWMEKIIWHKGLSDTIVLGSFLSVQAEKLAFDHLCPFIFSEPRRSLQMKCRADIFAELIRDTDHWNKHMDNAAEFKLWFVHSMAGYQKSAELEKTDCLREIRNGYSVLKTCGKDDLTYLTPSEADQLMQIDADPEAYYLSTGRGYEFLRNMSPKNYPQIVERWYQEKTGRILSLADPVSFTEKIQWLKLYDCSPLKTMLTDKIACRTWIREKIGDSYLVPVLGIWQSFDEIDFDLLPEQFALKCNHGCGYNLFVRDRSSFDLHESKRKFDRWLKTNYALINCLELQYVDIHPCIYAEKYIGNGYGNVVNYRVYCFNGQPRIVLMGIDSWIGKNQQNAYDIEFNRLPIQLPFPEIDPPIDKSHNWETICDLARVLSEGFCFTRVDFMESDGKLYFGEMTFTPGSGMRRFNEEEWERKTGEWIILPTKTPLPEKSLAERGVPARIDDSTESQTVQTSVRELEQENRRLRNEIDQILESRSYRVGKQITDCLSQIKRFLPGA